MKKLIAVLLIIALMLSSAACRTNGKEDVDYGDIYTAHEDVHEDETKEKEPELIEFDPFEYYELTLTGGYGSATVCQEVRMCAKLPDGSEIFLPINVEAPENDGSLKNGDKVHVSLKDVDENDLREQGYTLTRTEADIEVYGLNAYGHPNAKDGEKATVNLNEYVYIWVDDTFQDDPHIVFSIDYEELIHDYKSSLNENVAPEDCIYDTNKIATNALYSFKHLTPVFIIQAGCPNENGEGSYSTTLNGGYKNGDVIQLSWQVNEEYLAKLQKVMNVDFTCSDFTYTVETSVEFDPFANCEVTFKGENGFGTVFLDIIIDASLNNGEEKIIEVDLRMRENGFLSNGDVLTLSVASYERMLKDNYDLVPTRTELEVTVSGLD